MREHRRAAALGRRPASAAIDGSRNTPTDEQVLTELYRLHGRVVFAFVLRLVDDHATAEDVAQETMLRAWRDLDSIDPARGDPGRTCSRWRRTW